MPEILISHPTGNVFFRATAQGLLDAGSLQAVYTSIAVFPQTLLYNLASFKILSELRRRSLPAAFKKITHTHAFSESARLIATRLNTRKLTQHEKGMFCVDAVYKELDQYVAHNLKKEKARGLTAVYAYEDGAYYSFKKAKELGIKCICDLPIGYWHTMHALLLKEKEMSPEWASTLGGLRDSKEKLNRKDEELRMADVIFVASSFTLNTLKDYPGTLKEVKVIPYGFPPASPKTYPSPNGKLKLLFVGGLSQRKGLSYLFKAVEKLKGRVELTVLGSGETGSCRPLQDNLAKHTWIKTLPHNKVLELMRQHDVLVFPSLFEGFGQVITEAMAQGTPVITTERTAGPDIIEHEKNGWLVNAGSAEAITAILEQLLLRPQLIAAVGGQACETAKKRPWRTYQEEIARACKAI